MSQHYFVSVPASRKPRPGLPLILGLCLCLPGITAYATGMEIRFAYLGSDRDAAYLGVKQGLSEANLQGQFLGQTYSVDVLDPAGTDSPNLSPYVAVLVSADTATLRSLAGRAAGRPVFNLRSDDEALREACIPNLLHIVPGARMKQDAVAQWRVKNPDARVTASAWHPEFLKFAGRDLNKRFRAAYETGMEEPAWAGWAAVKMTSDTIARQGISDPAGVLEFLKTHLVFDGQKGVEMNFRETGQLRQPLLLVEDGKIVGEAPVRGVAESEDDLDSLGPTSCKTR